METFSTVLSPSVTVTVGMWASWNAFLLFFFSIKFLHTAVVHSSLVPRPHAQLLSLAVRKVRRRPGRIYHMMRAAADVTFSLLISGSVLSPFFP